MAAPNAEKPAHREVNGPQGIDHTGRLNDSSNSNSDLITQLNCARDRLDTIEQLSTWKLDLQARLWREQQAFMFADTERDFGHLAAEVEVFRRVAKAYAWKGGVQ